MDKVPENTPLSVPAVMVPGTDKFPMVAPEELTVVAAIFPVTVSSCSPDKLVIVALEELTVPAVMVAGTDRFVIVATGAVTVLAFHQLL